MNTKITSLSFLALVLLFISCKNNSNKKENLTDENSVVIEDKFGEVRIPKSPKRVVVYTYQALDLMDELGIADNIVGFPKSNTPDYLEKFKDDSSLEDYGGTKEPNFEKINAANPDLIIIEHRVEKDREELAKIAPTLYIDVDYDDYIGSIRSNVKILGKLYDIEGKAKEVTAEMDDVIETNKAPKNAGKGLVVMFNNGNFSAFGGTSRFGFIHDDFGVTPVSKDIESSLHGYNISSEYIQQQNPDYLFVVDKNAAHHEGDINKSGVENDLIKETNAYKNDNIIYFTADLWYYGGGGTLGMKMMAKEIGKAFNNE